MRNLTLSRHLRDMITVPQMAGSIVGKDQNVFQVNKYDVTMKSSR